MKMLLAVMIAAVCALTAPVGTSARLVDVERSDTFVIGAAVTPIKESSVGFAAVAPAVDEAPSETTSVVPKAEETTTTTTTTVTETSSTTTSVAPKATAPTTVADTSSTTPSIGPGQDHCPASGTIPASGEPSTTSPGNLDEGC